MEESSKICNHVIVRTNLVILLDEAYKYLIEVYAKNKVEIVCSLPYYRAAEMDKVRGDGSFDKAIEVLRCLNATGYGKSPELVLNMVYNPAGAFFPPDQEAMEKEYNRGCLQILALNLTISIPCIIIRWEDLVHFSGTQEI